VFYGLFQEPVHDCSVLWSASNPAGDDLPEGKIHATLFQNQHINTKFKHVANG